jgi:hypothetical protein
MRSNEDFEDIVKKDLDVRASDGTHERMRRAVLDAHGPSQTNTSARSPIIARSMIMKNPIVKLAVAAAVIAVIGLGTLEFLGTGSKSGVVWAEVAQKVNASRGLIYRESHPNGPDAAVYFLFYDSPTHGRTDMYQEGQLVRSVYGNYGTRDMLIIHHRDRFYGHHPMDDRDVQDHERQMHLRDWVEGILSRQHTNLGRKTIEGVLCEGIETKYPIFGDMNSPAENSARRVWVSVEGGYPLRCEGGTLGDDGKLRVETVLDQFQWDVELEASQFEPEIPTDYEQM